MAEIWQNLGMPGKLVAFDIDGTLLPDTTISLHMSQYLNCRDLIAKMERDWDRHQIDHREFAERSAAAYADLPLAKAELWAAEIIFISGARELVSALRLAGFKVILATVSLAFAARVLARRLGCDAAGGTELELVDGRFTGRIARFNDETDKARYVEGYCRARGIAMTDCIAVGDSRSDLPLFQMAGYSIAFNASADARAAADLSIETRNLLDLKPFLFAGVAPPR